MKRAIFQHPKNKYGARTCSYGGSLYHSRFEAAYAQELDQLKKAKKPEERVKDWKRQVKIPLAVNGTHICNWYCDFEVTYADGRVELVEVKGFTTPEWKIKEKLFRALYPERELRIVR